MTVTALCNICRLDWLLGVHQSGDEYRIALYTDAATLDENTTAYTTDNEVVGLGYTAGGRALTGFTGVMDGHAAFLDFNDPVWDPATITARAAMIYNASKSNKALAVFDLGGNVTSTNGPWTATLPSPTKDTAVLRID